MWFNIRRKNTISATCARAMSAFALKQPVPEIRSDTVTPLSV